MPYVWIVMRSADNTPIEGFSDQLQAARRAAGLCKEFGQAYAVVGVPFVQ